MATKTKTRTAPEQARAEVARLEQLEQHWRQAAASAEARLADRESTRGAEILAAGDSDAHAAEVVREIADLRGQVETATAAADAAAAQLVAARDEVLRADAAELRAQAAAKRAEADERQTKTDRLLAELRDHELRDFRSVGTVTRINGSGPELEIVPTATDLLRREADRLDDQAEHLERQAAAD